MFNFVHRGETITVKAPALSSMPRDGDLFAYRSLIGVIITAPTPDRQTGFWEFTLGIFGVFRLLKENSNEAIEIGQHVAITRSATERTGDGIYRVKGHGETLIGICVDHNSPIGDEYVEVKLLGMGVVDPNELETRLQHLETGVSHNVEVLQISNMPPLDAPAGDFYIVGTSPAGPFEGHANEVAVSIDGVSWQFTPPAPGDAHLVLYENRSVVWNGTKNAWVTFQQNAKAPDVFSGTWANAETTQNATFRTGYTDIIRCRMNVYTYSTSNMNNWPLFVLNAEGGWVDMGGATRFVGYIQNGATRTEYFAASTLSWGAGGAYYLNEGIKADSNHMVEVVLTPVGSGSNTRVHLRAMGQTKSDKVFVSEFFFQLPRAFSDMRYMGVKNIQQVLAGGYTVEAF